MQPTYVQKKHLWLIILIKLFIADQLRPKVLKDGFTKELEARKTTLDASKAELETLYAQRLDDLEGKPELSNKVDSAIRSCDAALTSYAGTMKSIKLAIEPHFKIYCSLKWWF